MKIWYTLYALTQQYTPPHYGIAKSAITVLHLYFPPFLPITISYLYVHIYFYLHPHKEKSENRIEFSWISSERKWKKSLNNFKTKSKLKKYNKESHKPIFCGGYVLQNGI